MLDLPGVLLAAVSVLFIGLSKAGFGGGLGMLTTPLCVLAFSRQGASPAFAIGILLPLLCAGDAVSLYHYWGKWERKNLLYLLPGVMAGVLIGVRLIGRLTKEELNFAIGTLAVGFVVFQFVKEKDLNRCNEFILQRCDQLYFARLELTRLAASHRR